MLCLSGFELYSRWVPLIFSVCRSSKRKMSFKSKFIANDINLFGCKTLLKICNDRALWDFLLKVVTHYWKLLLQQCSRRKFFNGFWTLCCLAVGFSYRDQKGGMKVTQPLRLMALNCHLCSTPYLLFFGLICSCNYHCDYHIFN